MDDRFRRDQTASNDCQVESQLIHLMRVDADNDLGGLLRLMHGGSPLQVNGGPGGRAIGQDCNGTTPSSSYQVTSRTTGGCCPRGRHVNAMTQGQS